MRGAAYTGFVRQVDSSSCLTVVYIHLYKQHQYDPLHFLYFSISYCFPLFSVQWDLVLGRKFIQVPNSTAILTFVDVKTKTVRQTIRSQHHTYTTPK